MCVIVQIVLLIALSTVVVAVSAIIFSILRSLCL